MKRILPVFIMLLGVAAHAKQDKRLTNLVKHEVSPVVEALAYDPAPELLPSTDQSEASEDRQDYELKRLSLRFQFKAGFDISVVKIVLVPEVELIFQKD